MEGNILPALLLSCLAGSAALLGGLAAVIKTPGKRLLAAALGFSGGIMMTVSLGDLLPHAAEVILMAFPPPMGGLALASACGVGMLSAAFLDTFLPEPKPESSGMLRLGVFSMLALMLHNIPEGMAVFLSGNADLRVGTALALAIALHNIPEGISVAMPVMAAGKGRGTAMAMVAVSAVAEPLGGLLACLFLAPFISQTGIALLYAGIGGLMLYIVAAQILPASRTLGKGRWALVGTLVGILVMLVSISIF